MNPTKNAVAVLGWLLCGVVGAVCLGCRPEERGTAPQQEREIVYILTAVADPGAALFKTMSGRGGSVTINEQYSIACGLEGTVSRQGAAVDVSIVLAIRPGAQKDNEAHWFLVDVISTTLGNRTFSFGTTHAQHDEQIQVEVLGDYLHVTLKDIYQTGLRHRNQLPSGEHELRVTITLDKHEPVTLEEPLNLRVLNRP